MLPIRVIKLLNPAVNKLDVRFRGLLESGCLSSKPTATTLQPETIKAELGEDGHYWEDQKNVHSIAAGGGKGITYISGITPHYPPLTLDWDMERKKVVEIVPKKKGWYNVGRGVNKTAKRNEKGVIIK